MPGVTTIPFWQGKSTVYAPRVFGTTKTSLAAVAAAIVAASLTLPPVDPATRTETRTTRPLAAFTSVAAVTFNADDTPVPVINAPAMTLKLFACGIIKPLKLVW